KLNELPIDLAVQSIISLNHIQPNESGKIVHCIVIGGAAGVYTGSSLSIDQKS
ncbi:unnamed protein product, partial [Rotaria sordida]